MTDGATLTVEQGSFLRSPRVRRWVLAGVALVVLVVLSLLRQAGSESWRTLFAEDGPVFLRGSIVDGLDAFTVTYAGYLHTLPRLLALPESVFPVSWAASYSAAAGAAVAGACALVQFHVTRDLIQSAVLRAMLAGSVVLAPVMIIETLNNLAYAFWPLSVACFWVLLLAPRSRIDTVAGAVVGFLAMASQPLNFVFAPLALAAWLRDRNRRTTTVLVAVVAGFLVQIAGVVSAPSTELQVGARELESLLRGYGVRVLGAAWLGEPWLRSAWLELGSVLVAVTVLVSVVLLGVLFAKAEPAARPFALIALAYSFVFGLVTSFGRGAVIATAATGEWQLDSTRYIVVPLLLFLGTVVILADHARFRPRTGQLVRAGLVAWVAVLVVVGFRADNFRSDGPEWQPTVAEARRACEGRHPDDEVVLRNPPDGFAVSLPCRDLR